MGYPRGVMPLAERLERNSEPEPNSGCVLWTGRVLPNGYGKLNVWDPASKTYTTEYAHRAAYRLAHGAITAPCLDHLCRVRNCINVRHLEAVTQRENVLRGHGPTKLRAMTRRRASAPACSRGHAWTEENTYRHARGRRCRQCVRDRMGANGHND